MSKIYKDIISLRELIGGLQAKKKDNGPKFAVKDAKELMLKLRAAGDKLGMPIVGAVVSQTTHHYPTRDLGVNKYGTAMFGTMVHVTSTVRFMSDDGSFIDVVGSGHGGDDQDKAGGKASTYAWKDAILKGLSIPDAEMLDTDDEQPFQSFQKTTLVSILNSIASVTSRDAAKALYKSIDLDSYSDYEADQINKAMQDKLNEL
jgi:hypothetical protein